LRVYKNYINETLESYEKYKKINLKNCELELNKERDNEFGFYIKIKLNSGDKLEIWTETLKDYELFVNYLKNITKSV